MFETQKSGNKTSSGEIGLNMRTPASPEVGQDQVPGGESIPCRHADIIFSVPYSAIKDRGSTSARRIMKLTRGFPVFIII